MAFRVQGLGVYGSGTFRALKFWCFRVLGCEGFGVLLLRFEGSEELSLAS